MNIASLVWLRAMSDMLKCVPADEDDLTGSYVAVLWALSTYTDNETGTGAFPSQATLGKVSRTSPKTAQRVLDQAIELNMIECLREGGQTTDPRTGRKYNVTALYRLVPPVEWRVPGYTYRAPEAIVQVAHVEAEIPTGTGRTERTFTPPNPRPVEKATTEDAYLPGDELTVPYITPGDLMAEKTARYGPEWRALMDAGDVRAAHEIVKSVRAAERVAS